MKRIKKVSRYFSAFALISLGIFAVLLFNHSMSYTSSNEFCTSCHVHPQAFASWRLGAHFDTKSGFVADCVDCHLPPAGWDYLSAKAITGARDVYGVLFKSEDKMNWEQKSSRDYAVKHVYKASCLHCHQNLFPRRLTKKGEDAHLYYDQNRDNLRCINCHLQTGHFHKPMVAVNTEKETIKEMYTAPAFPDSFINFTETIPGTFVNFNMIAIPGGDFTLGSPESESYRDSDEGPQRKVRVSPFWMAEIEVSWNEYDAFYSETGSGDHNEQNARAGLQKVDAVTGPTPAYGNPDQGWGRGKKPAITMTHFAAQKYCEWLSQKTNKTYRLPTEAEWEYACRAGQQGAYFFEGDPEDFSNERLANVFFGSDTLINEYIVYQENSKGMPQSADKVKPNPFGLRNMLGGVKEFCADYYKEDAYTQLSKDVTVTDPQGPQEGVEFVVRGGSFKSSIADVRSAARQATQSRQWLITDPQIPKSRWWYSDCNDVGFRVVCENPVISKDEG